MSNTVTFPASSDKITYSPTNAWTLSGNGSKSTSTLGATATFSFDGVFVQVFGTIPSHNHSGPRPNQVSSYTMDNLTSTSFSTINQTQHGQQTQVFYQAPELPSGHHVLVINYTQLDGNFTLSSIVVGLISSPSDSAPTPLLSPSPTSSPASSVSRKPNVGAIVGGVLAALILAAFILAFFLFRRRRNQKSQKDKNRAVTPFIPEQNTRRSQGYSVQRDPFADGPSTPAVISDEKTPLPAFTPSYLSRHGSMYKPKTDSNGLPSPAFGYGGGV